MCVAMATIIPRINKILKCVLCDLFAGWSCYYRIGVNVQQQQAMAIAQAATDSALFFSPTSSKRQRGLISGGLAEILAFAG